MTNPSVRFAIARILRSMLVSLHRSNRSANSGVPAIWRAVIQSRPVRTVIKSCTSWSLTIGAFDGRSSSCDIIPTFSGQTALAATLAAVALEAGELPHLVDRQTADIATAKRVDPGVDRVAKHFELRLPVFIIGFLAQTLDIIRMEFVAEHLKHVGFRRGAAIQLVFAV